MIAARRLTILSAVLLVFTFTLLHLYRRRSSLSLAHTTQISDATSKDGLVPNTSSTPDLNPNNGSFGADSKHGSSTPTSPETTHSRHIVVAKMRDENASWLETTSFKDVTPMIYVPDDPDAHLHVPANKGHEAMIYLTYLIDHYDDFPDIAIFMHAHQQSWHQGGLLQHDAIETVSRLSSERVLRQGYMNLRCEWNPGCPAWLHPGAARKDSQKPEEPEVARAWTELFPGAGVPEVIAQPCCSQFALSKKAMLAVPKERFVFYRDWLLRTKLRDSISGRVFEYFWQYIFTGSPTFCPDMYECYCDGYGICFQDDKDFDYWFQLLWERFQKTQELDQWKKQAAALEKHRQNGVLIDIESSVIEIPVPGQDLKLTREIEEIQARMDEGRLKAIERGKDPAFRAKAARRSFKEGDGF